MEVEHVAPLVAVLKNIPSLFAVNYTRGGTPKVFLIGSQALLPLNYWAEVSSAWKV